MKSIVILISCLVSLTLCAHKEPATQSLLCDICEFVGEEVDRRVLTDDAKRQVIYVAQKVCNSLPFFSAECNTALNEHGKDLVDQLFALWDVDMLCAEAHLCKSAVELPGFFALKEGEKCRACIDGLDMVKLLISSDDMKDMLHVIVNETCMAVGGDVASCENLVDTILDEILDNLVPMFDVNALCAQAGACPSSHILKAPSELECDVCEDVFSILEQVVVSEEAAEILSIGVNETCGLIGYGEDLCVQIGNLLTDALLKNLEELAGPSYACGALGACPAAALTLTPSEDDGCKACMDGLGIVDMILKSPDLLDLVNITVHEICLAAGADHVGTCVSIVDGVVEPIIRNLIALFDPASLCQQAGACPALLVSPYSPQGGIFCVACVDAVLELQNIAEDHETEDMISQLTNILCDNIKIPFCKSVIGTLVKESLQDVENLNPNTTCANMGACTSSSSLSPLEGGVCAECAMVADQVLKVLESGATQAGIKEGIAGVCAVVPIPGCTDLLEGYVAQLLEYLKTVDGKAVCSLVGLC